MNRDNLTVTFQDILQIIKKRRGKVLLWTLFFASLAGAYSLTRGAGYISQASFRDKGKLQAGFKQSLTDMMFGGLAGGTDNETVSSMKSHKLISEVIKELHLQGVVLKSEVSYPKLENMRDNAMAEYAYWQELKTPFLKEVERPLTLKHITYTGEVTKHFHLKFINLTHYIVSDDNHKEIGRGELDKPFMHGDARFTVITEQAPPEVRVNYLVALFPMPYITKVYANNLTIDADREDRSLVRLQYKHRDRHLAARFLNSLMKNYQTHLKKENELINFTQLDYLNKRQSEMGLKLKEMMQNHALTRTEDLSSTGFTDARREMEFLAQNLMNGKQKLNEIDLETKRLANVLNGDFAFYDAYTGRGDPSIINNLLSEMRNYKHHRDILILAVQNTPQRDPSELKTSFDQQIAQLEKIQKCCSEAQTLKSSLEKNSIPQLNVLNNDPMVALWVEKLRKPLPQEEKEFLKSHFNSYLDNLIHLYKVQESTTQEHLAHQQNPHTDLSGITLETARNLYVSYNQQLNEIHGQQKLNQFVTEQIADPSFEIVSLGSMVNDPVSAERIARSSQILMQMKDENNRSSRELDRLKEDLRLQREFLALHITQMCQLLTLKENLAQEKIGNLQQITLQLTNQQLSILEKHLNDYIQTRLENLESEKQMIANHQKELSAKVAAIPGKLAEEQMIDQHLLMNQRFVENLTNIIESKNISSNLELIQSSPVDNAVAEVVAKPPYMVFFMVIGAMLGLMGSALFFFTRSFLKGLPPSIENLKLAGLTVAGTISPKSYQLPEKDLHTLRHLVQDLVPGKAILCLNRCKHDFTPSLAHLFSKHNAKTVIVSVDFDRETENGLLSYLEEKISFPQIDKKEFHDLISCGGISRFGQELLNQARFKELIEKLQNQYDWVVVTTKSSIKNAEVENLVHLFDNIVLNTTSESLNELVEFKEAVTKDKNLIIALGSRS